MQPDVKTNILRINKNAGEPEYSDILWKKLIWYKDALHRLNQQEVEDNIMECGEQLKSTTDAIAEAWSAVGIYRLSSTL